ncbi:MAG: aldo/keto reductase [Clostridia bacterium]|nr:aldo/keto reductase [Clostridia bacterium]
MKYSDSFGKRSSKIILGTGYFGDGITEEESFQIMDAYYELGGRHIDTARLYADGASEKIVGKWLKGRKPADIFVSTKGGFYDVDACETPRLNEEDIRFDLEQSLTALGLDCVDFYWLHRDDENVSVSEIIDLMNSLVKEGKIKQFGASNWRSERIGEANEYAKENGLIGLSASQIRFNPAYCIGERGGLVGMDAHEFSFYKNNSMPVVAYSSQAKGFFSKMAEQGEDALSEKAKKRYLCDENLRRLEIIKQIATDFNCSVASVVCGLLCSIPEVDVFPVIGGRNVSQITDSMNGADITIPSDAIKSVLGSIY